MEPLTIKLLVSFIIALVAGSVGLDIYVCEKPVLPLEEPSTKQQHP